MRSLCRALSLVLCGLLLTSGGSGCQDDPAPTVILSGRVADIFTVESIEGAELCRLESPNRGCAVSDEEGRFALTLPANGEHWFTVTHEEYYPFLLAMTTQDEDIPLPGPVSIGSNAVMELVLSQTGVEVGPGQGHLLLWVADETGVQGQAGATIEISPDPGGDGVVVYVDEQGAYSQDATSTSSAGSAGWGNIPPGDYVLTVRHPELECEPYSSFSAGEPNTFRLKTIAGYATALFVRCQ